MLKHADNYYKVTKINFDENNQIFLKQEFQLPLGSYNTTVLHLLNDGYSVNSDEDENLVLTKNNIQITFDFISEWEEA